MRQANPCLVNSYNPRTGASLLRFAVDRADNPLLVTLLLHAQCRFGLYPDKRGSTPLKAALMSSKWRPLRLLLYALRTNPTLSEMPGSMIAVSECLELLARRYPDEFLSLIKQMPLQPEPEVKLH